MSILRATVTHKGTAHCWVTVDSISLSITIHFPESLAIDHSADPICEDRSDRDSCGQESSESEEEAVTTSLGNSSVHRPFAPSIALTYRNLRTLSLSNHLLIDALSAFSVRSSITYLFRNSTREVKLANLLRVTSSFWVIFSHTCLFSMNFTDTIRSVTESEEKDGGSVVGWKSFMLNSSLAVDTFLFLSACLVSYSIRKRMLFR